jgi:hydrogenase/urease accessory protein HupE
VRAGGVATLGLIVVVLLAAAGAPGRAHPLAPALLELTEGDAGRVDVHWRTSRLRPRGANVEPRLPDGCRATSAPRAGGDEVSVSLRWSADCGAEGLVGRVVAVDGLGAAPIDVLVRIALSDGRVVHRVLRAGEATLTVPARPTRTRVLTSYGRLGIEHILTGPDHLLFVLGLLLLVRRPGALVRTITAFTLGHSLTLSIVALDLVRVPSAPVELLIAVSVLVLAVELARGRDRPPDALTRNPWWMACAFGLLHGMGFAGALAEIGLPQTEIPVALLAFNVGIEIGQLAFVAGVGAAGWLLRAPLAAAPRAWRRVPAYAIGISAAFWCFERAAAL